MKRKIGRTYDIGTAVKRGAALLAAAVLTASIPAAQVRASGINVLIGGDAESEAPAGAGSAAAADAGGSAGSGSAADAGNTDGTGIRADTGGTAGAGGTSGGMTVMIDPFAGSASGGQTDTGSASAESGAGESASSESASSESVSSESASPESASSESESTGSASPESTSSENAPAEGAPVAEAPLPPASDAAALSIAESTLEAVPEGEDRLIRLGFAGDINFDEKWATTEYMDVQGGILKVLSPNLVGLLRDFDLFMLNNEFTYSTRGEEVDKTYHFRADPSRVENLKTIGTDLVLLANNHVFDYGEEAMLDTFDTLDGAGIPYVGAGRDIGEAMRPVIVEIAGRRIAFVGASSAEEYTPSIATRAADEGVSGILACYDPERFLQAIRHAAEAADFVVASVHWGMEYEEKYYDSQRELAVRMVEAGADAVIGSHTHCLQGVNIIDGAPVFYSLGNFWFNDLDLYTGVAELTLRIPADPSKAVSLEATRFYPCTQYALFTNMPEDQTSKNEIFAHLESISRGLISIDAEGTITTFRADGAAESTVESLAESNVESIAESVAESLSESGAESTAVSFAESAAESGSVKSLLFPEGSFVYNTLL